MPPRREGKRADSADADEIGQPLAESRDGRYCGTERATRLRALLVTTARCTTSRPGVSLKRLPTVALRGCPTGTRIDYKHNPIAANDSSNHLQAWKPR